MCSSFWLLEFKKSFATLPEKQLDINYLGSFKTKFHLALSDCDTDGEVK